MFTSAIASSVTSQVAAKSSSKLLSRIATVGAGGLAIVGAVLVGKRVVDCLKKTKQTEPQTKSNPESQSTSDPVEIDLGTKTPKAIVIAEVQADEELKSDRDMAKAKRIAITHSSLVSRAVDNHNGSILERVLSDSKCFQENGANFNNVLNILRNEIILDTRHHQDVEPATISEVMDTVYSTTNLPQWAIVALVVASARLASIDVENQIRGCANLWTPSISREEINGIAANVVDYKAAISSINRMIEEIYKDLYQED